MRRDTRPPAEAHACRDRSEHENMLYAAQVNSKALQRVTPFIPKNDPEGAALPASRDRTRVVQGRRVRVGQLAIGQFDSHANNDPDQMKLIPEFLAGIAYMIAPSGELKIREQLVVVVQSEMGRTPNYNRATARITGRSARPCSSAKGSRGTA